MRNHTHIHTSINVSYTRMLRHTYVRLYFIFFYPFYLFFSFFPCFFLSFVIFSFYTCLFFLEHLKSFHVEYTSHSCEVFSTGETLLNERSLSKPGISYNPRQSRNLNPSTERDCGSYFYRSSISTSLCFFHSNPLPPFSFSI